MSQPTDADSDRGEPRIRVRFPISWKLLAVTVVVGVVALWIAVAGLQRVSMLNERLSRTVDYSSENIRLAALLKQDLVTVTRAEKNMMLARSDEEMSRFTASIDDKLIAMHANLQRLNGLTDREDRPRLTRFAKKWNEWKENHQSVRNFSQLNSDLRARQLALGQGLESFEELETALATLAAANARDLETAVGGDAGDQRAKAARRTQALTELLTNLAQIQRVEKQIILAPTEEEMQEHEKLFDALQKDIEEGLNSLKPSSGDAEAAIGDAEKAIAEYADTVAEIRAFLGQKQNFFVHHFAYEVGGPLSAESEQILDEIIDENEKDMQAFRDASQQTYVMARNSLVVFGAVGILVSVVVSLVTGQRIAGNLGRLAGYARDVQVAGDLSRPVPRVGRDEVGLVAEAFDHMRQSLHRQTSELSVLNAALEQKNDEMEQFVYTVSHDLKSPLVSCKGLVGLIREDIADGDYQEVLASAERLDDATNQLSRIIDDLLSLSRIGRKSLELTEIDVATLVEKVHDELRDQFEETGVRLVVEANLPKIVADQTDVRRVFENLFDNALKYSRRAQNPTVTVGGVNRGDSVRYFVRDNGPGIDPKYHDRIFGLFQRLDTDEPGTGVGLASVAKIARMHGGRAWVESSLGEGATFWIEFRKPPHVL